MSLDTLETARQIREPIQEFDDIQAAFDGITYSKGQAVLEMTEGWMGPDRFRSGVQAYMKEHAWGNATAEDFFASLGSAADHLPVCAPKGQLGHLLGGAGAVETILALQALRHGVLPGSLNADPLDPEVELAVANRGPVELSSDQSQRLLLKNAFGFGGHNISLVLAGSTPARPG